MPATGRAAPHRPGDRPDGDHRRAVWRHPLRTSACRARSGLGGCARPRSGKAGTAPTNRHPHHNRPTDPQRSLISLRAHLEHYRDQAVRASECDQVNEIDDAIREVEEATAVEGLRGTVAPPHGADQVAEPKRQRSTRRRQDAPDLPPAAGPAAHPRAGLHRTGRHRTPPVDVADHDPRLVRTRTTDGSPVDPRAYDYQRAAWDAITFPDCWTASGRTCAGASAGTSSTPDASSRNGVSPHTRTSRSGAPSPAPSCGKS